MPFAAGGRQHAEVDLAAAGAEGVGHLPRQFGREIAVIGRHQPEHRHPRVLGELGRGRNQRVRRADLMGRIVGVAAAARREGDDGRDHLRVLGGERQGTPGAGGMPDHDGAVRPDKGLPAQIASAALIESAVA